VWHGSADRTVNPINASEIVKQWLNVHHLPPTPMSESEVDGYPRALWWNADGETLVESYTITDMAHGTPLGMGDNDERYGTEGAFLIEAGISSSYHIASFFGLTGRVHQPAITVAPPAFPPPPPPEINPIPWPVALYPGSTKPRPPTRRPPIDVSAVITRALAAAGLMK